MKTLNLTCIAKIVEMTLVSKNLIKICSDESGKYKKIEGFRPEGKLTNKCPFCDGETSSGSWTPDKCKDCGAVYFFNAWSVDIVE